MHTADSAHDRMTIGLAACGAAVLLAACLPVDSGRRQEPYSPAPVSAQAFAGHIRTLSSDAFEGRAPSSPGERKTIEYIRDRFMEFGLQPGGSGSWFQEVPLVKITASPDAHLLIEGNGTRLGLEYKQDMVVWTKRVTEAAAIDRSELVFVGYGIVAPEYGWDDYAGLDMEGKTAVILVNDPGYATGDPALFTGKAMTWYGRWTYKFEEAARQRAAAALIIHEEAAAGYPWEVVSGSWTGPQFDLVTADGNRSRAAIEGWISREAAGRLFAAAGRDFAEAGTAAGRRGFRAASLGLRASSAVANTVEKSTSSNVIGVLPGSERPDETILYLAHWDHLGRDDTLEGDQIYNGALDNATGVAAVLELARAFAALPERPDRSVVFLAVTAEESGLLGSAWYAEHPPFPLAKTVAAINIDRMSMLGETRDVTVIGHGSSELETYLARAAAAQGRKLEPEPTPEKGYFYRSDHFNLSRRGVPVLYVKGGIDHVTRGRAWGARQEAAYTADRYHKPGDEFDDGWDFSGALADIEMLFAVGRQLSGERGFPNWHEGNEFRAIRERSRAGLD